MTQYRVRHVTRYRYKSPVAFGTHRVMLRPRESIDQRTLGLSLAIEPAPETLRWSEDPSGNAVAHATFGRRATELVFTSDVLVENIAFDAASVDLPRFARTMPFSYEAEETADLARFIERQHSDPDHLVDSWVRDVLAETPGHETWPFLVRLNATIRRDFAYLRRDEKGIQPPARTLRTRRGSCRDFALLMIEAVRNRGLAARFVSGYLRVRSDQNRTVLAGGSTHAWLQVFLPKTGWVDFDPTSGEVGNRDLIRVAVVRDPEAAVPIGGSFMGFPSDYIGMSVQVGVIIEAGPDASPARPEQHGAVLPGSRT